MLHFFPFCSILLISCLKVGEGSNVEEMESNEEQEKSLLDSLLQVIFMFLGTRWVPDVLLQEGLDFEEDIPSYLEDPLVHWGVQVILRMNCSIEEVYLSRFYFLGAVEPMCTVQSADFLRARVGNNNIPLWTHLSYPVHPC